MEAYIKLQRKLLDWEWYSDMVTKTVFIHLLLKANWKDGRWKGYEVKRGSLITGRRVLAEELNLSEQQIRTALSHLKSTNEITIKPTTRFSVITIVNYDRYQQVNQQDDQEATNNQPSSNQRPTTIEEFKNNKNNKNKEFKENDTPNGVSKRKCFTPPSLEEVQAYCQERDNNVDPQRFIDFYESKGWLVGKNKMKSWEAAVRTWESRDKDQPKTANEKTWGAKIYDLSNEQNYPFFGFPSEWFSGNELIESKVKAVIHPVDPHRGIYEEITIQPQELIALYKLRRDYYEQRK